MVLCAIRNEPGPTICITSPEGITLRPLSLVVVMTFRSMYARPTRIGETVGEGGCTGILAHGRIRDRQLNPPPRNNIADVLLMRQALDDCNGPIEITSVTDGGEALELLGSGAEFDVVILDLNLPKLNGFEFLERSKRTFPPVVVFTSSHSDYDEKSDGDYGLGARQSSRSDDPARGHRSGNTAEDTRSLFMSC